MCDVETRPFKEWTSHSPETRPPRTEPAPLPPTKTNILDSHGGFTIMDNRGNTLWRPGAVLKGKPPIGTLQSWKGDSFYQLNNDVTQATYKVPGYNKTVVCWFDNRTGERIA